VKRIVRFTVIAALIFAVAAPQVALSQTATAGPAIEVFTYGAVPDTLKMRYDAALRGAILFTSREFGQMPLTLVRLRLYENEELFARGLMELTGLSEERAARFARMFVGAAIEPHTIVIKIDHVRHRASSQLIVTAELVHLLQSSWAGSVHRIAVWIREGQASFYSTRNVEYVAGPHAAGHYRRSAIAALKERRGEVLQFSIAQAKWVDTFLWVDTVVQLGNSRDWSLAYAYALLAYEFLLEKTSVQATLDYFTRLRDGMSSDDAFLAAFGMSKTDFDARFRERVRVLVGQP
jgi:hypothetical protein